MMVCQVVHLKSDKFLEDLDELGLQTHLPSTRMMGLSEQH